MRKVQQGERLSDLTEICVLQFTFVANIEPERTATGEVKDRTPESA